MRFICRPPIYEQTDFLGEGLTSWVYRAKKLDTSSLFEQTVALKILKSQKMVRHFKHEFETLCKVRSVYCVQVFGWEYSCSRPALVLEFVEGANLEQLSCHCSINRAELVEIILQIQEGLKALAETNLCHGDLSLRNILINSSGQVKIVDFGVPGKDWGTPEFLAPERLQGENPSLSSDLFSLGRIAERLGCCDGEIINTLKTRRRYILGKSQTLIRESLAGKVQSYLHSKKASPVTRQLQPIQYFHRPLVQYLLAMLLVFLPAHKPLKGTQAKAYVVIRSQRWVHVSIDGKSFGTSPGRSRGLKPGTHHIEWHRGEIRGERILTLTAGETRVLTDRDFFVIADRQRMKFGFLSRRPIGSSTRTD